jgi:lysophospholipase L1-like esterase
MSRQYVKLASSKIVFDGNSITEGAGSGAGAANISAQVSAQLIAQKIFGVSVVNLGVGGQTCAQMIDDGSSQVAPLREAGRDCIIVANEGGNDIYFGATAAQAFQNIRDYCLLRKSEGFYVLVWSCPNRNNGFSSNPSGDPSAYQAALLDFNNKLAAGWKEFADGFMDTRKHFPYIPEANFPGAGGFWFPDCVHPSATGNAIIAAKLIEHLKLIPRQFRKAKPVPINNPVTETEFFWDAFSLPTTTGEFISTLTSGGSVVSAAINVNGRPGILTLSTLAVANGRAFVGTDRSVLELSGGEAIFGGSTQIPILSTATERFQLLIGFFDTATAANQVDGLYFLYDEGGVSTGSTAGPNWKLVASSNSVRTFVTSTIPVDTAWNNFKITLNSAGTRADYYINGLFAGSVATNLPIGGSARSVGLGAMIIKSIGTTARTVLLDWLYFKQILKVPRGPW